MKHRIKALIDYQKNETDTFQILAEGSILKKDICIKLKAQLIGK